MQGGAGGGAGEKNLLLSGHKGYQSIRLVKVNRLVTTFGVVPTLYVVETGVPPPNGPKLARRRSDRAGSSHYPGNGRKLSAVVLASDRRPFGVVGGWWRGVVAALTRWREHFVPMHTFCSRDHAMLSVVDIFRLCCRCRYSSDIL